MAEAGLRAMAGALPRVVAAGSDLEARGDALYGAWLCDTVLGSAAMGMHHKLCHVLGGSFGLPHAETHAVLLPHALAYNAAAAPEAMRRIAAAIGVAGGTIAAAGVAALARSLGAAPSLAALDMPADGIEQAAALAVAAPYPNPRPLERQAIDALLSRAQAGLEPLGA